VALHYFISFFLPTGLSADAGWSYVSGPFSGEALAGYLFVVALLVVAFRTSRSRETRPIAFGILWFFLALLPVSLMPLGDVTNDHRMFFPFVGLALAAFWSLRLLLFRKTARLTTNPLWLRGALAAVGVVLALAAIGTWSRNEVWHTEESLWRDVTIKNPQNARGLMNYGLVFLARHQYSSAIPYLERAEQLQPNYGPVQANLGVAYGGLERNQEAVQHFERALALAPDLAEPHIFYGRWLESKHRLAEAQAQLEAAVRANRLSFPARDLLAQVYTEQGNREALEPFLEETVKLAFNDEVARRYMAERAEREKNAEAAKYKDATPEALVNLSARYCNNGDYGECLAAAKKALELRPAYAEAYNNMAAAFLALQKWDEGIQAAREAIRIKPNYEAARSNLQWGLSHKPKTGK
jgi:tetratricopeptide (TPR) repeat protein